MLKTINLDVVVDWLYARTYRNPMESHSLINDKDLYAETTCIGLYDLL